MSMPTSLVARKVANESIVKDNDLLHKKIRELQDELKKSKEELANRPVIEKIVEVKKKSKKHN